MIEVIQLLLAKGAQLQDADDRGRTALMIAAERGHTEVAVLLLAAGASRTTRDNEGKTASDFANDTALRALLAP